MLFFKTRLTQDFIFSIPFRWKFKRTKPGQNRLDGFGGGEKMALFLVQHGKSVSRDVDPQKKLSDLGFRETQRISPVAKGYGIPVKKIFHSGKKRAEQTARIYHEALEIQAPMETISGINPLDDVRAFAARIDPDANWMVVGHMPFMERLVSYLTTGSEEIRVYRFQNSGIVCLEAEQNADGQLDWSIKWTLNPHIT